MGRSHECDHPSYVRDLPICTTARLDITRSSGQIDQDVMTLLQQALSIYNIELETLQDLQLNEYRYTRSM